MANYIDPKRYDVLFRECVENKKLSEEFIEMFKIHCDHVIKKFFIPDPDDRECAKSRCFLDLCLYWHNFKVENGLQLRFMSNFLPGDKFTIKIKNYDKDIIFSAGLKEDLKNNVFKIENTINKSIKSAIKVMEREKYNDIFRISGHSVTYKMTIHDMFNKSDLSIFSSVDVFPRELKKFYKKFDGVLPDMCSFELMEEIISSDDFSYVIPIIDKDDEKPVNRDSLYITKTDSNEFYEVPKEFQFIRKTILEREEGFVKFDKLHEIFGNNYSMRPASAAFLFLTSLATNSTIKSLSLTSPHELRNSKKISLSLNSSQNGIFSL